MNPLQALAESTDFATENFIISSLDDEIRADRLTTSLLQIYVRWLTAEEGKTPLEAGSMARGTDYFLKDFIIAECRENIFSPSPERIRQFAGHWYIVRNLEPNLGELGQILDGVRGYYRFLHAAGRLDSQLLSNIDAQSRELEYYGQRIDTFWEIGADGYDEWRMACPLPNRTGER